MFYQNFQEERKKDQQSRPLTHQWAGEKSQIKWAAHVEALLQPIRSHRARLLIFPHTGSRSKSAEPFVISVCPAFDYEMDCRSV